MTTRLRALHLLVAIALLSLCAHLLVNHRYGVHRDELPVLDDAAHLAWGYVVYPPVTPFVAHLAVSLFGKSVAGLRLFSTLGFCVAIVISGLMAQALGAGRWGQALAATAVATAAVPMHNSSLFQYVTFDYLAWVLCAYFVVLLVRTGDERWWCAIGAAIAFGMLSKYTMGALVIGLAVGVFATPLRRQLAHRWLWLGALLSLALFLPHFLWELRHSFISLEFLQHIHARDVGQGRGNDFLPGQLLVGSSIFTAPLWMAGLWFYFVGERGRPFRVLGWMFVVPLVLLTVAHGRDYYLAPAYPMLLAGGSTWWSEKLSSLQPTGRRLGLAVTLTLLFTGAVLNAGLLMPVATIGSRLWKTQIKLIGDFPDEIGWPELVDEIAAVFHAQPPGGRVAILAGNYGEAGAINLYGPSRHLPPAISGVNSYWERGYGQPEPETIVLVGFTRERAERFFGEVTLAGHVTNSLGVKNEESEDHPDIFVCRNPKLNWPELWQKLRGFG